MDMRQPVNLTGKNADGLEITVKIPFDQFLSSVFQAGYPVITFHSFMAMLPEGFGMLAKSLTRHVTLMNGSSGLGEGTSEIGSVSGESGGDVVSRKHSASHTSPMDSFDEMTRSHLQNLVDDQLGGRSNKTTRNKSNSPRNGPYQRQFMAHICDRCGKSYKSYAALAQHMRQKEYGPADLPYQCVECGKRFREARGIAVHCTKRNHKLPEGLTPRRLVTRSQV